MFDLHRIRTYMYTGYEHCRVLCYICLSMHSLPFADSLMCLTTELNRRKCLKLLLKVLLTSMYVCVWLLANLHPSFLSVCVIACIMLWFVTFDLDRHQFGSATRLFLFLEPLLLLLHVATNGFQHPAPPSNPMPLHCPLQRQHCLVSFFTSVTVNLQLLTPLLNEDDFTPALSTADCL